MKRNTVKRNVSLALGAVLVFGAVPAYAADAVTVKLNGSQMEFDVNPVIENSRTLVPFRKIFEALDCAVSYTKENGAQVVKAINGSLWKSAKTKSPLMAKQRSWMLRRKS